MKIRTMFWLAVLGGAYYAHRKRGGTLSYDSIMDSLRALANGIQNLGPAKVTPGAPDVTRSSRVSDYSAPH